MFELIAVRYQEGSGTYLRHVKIPLIPVDLCHMPNIHKEAQLCAGLPEGGRDACQVIAKLSLETSKRFSLKVLGVFSL